MNWFKKNSIGILLFIGLHTHASEQNKQVVIKKSAYKSITTYPNKFVSGDSDNNENTKAAYYLAASEWGNQIKPELKGVVDKNRKYIFIDSEASSTKPKNSNIITHYLDRLGQAEKSESHLNKSHYQYKHVLAYYETSIDMNKKTISLIFGLIQEGMHFSSDKIYVIFPELYSSSDISKDTTTQQYFFYSQYYKNTRPFTLAVQHLNNLKRSNETRFSKGSLYIPTIKNTANFCAYAFLYYTDDNRNKNVSNLIIGHIEAQQIFTVIEDFNSILVINQLKNLLSTNSEQETLVNLFYIFFNSKKSNSIEIVKETIKTGHVSCKINITDTQCFEKENGIETNIFVKIYLQTKIKGFTNSIKTSPIYAVFKTIFPYSTGIENTITVQKKHLELDWNAKFFHFLDSNNTPIDMKDLYFTPDDNEMSSNDVRPIKIVDPQHPGNAPHNSPVPSFIKSISNNGIEYENYSTLSQIAYSSNNVLALTNTPEEVNRQNKEITVVYQRFFQIQPTELLRTVLQNMINPIPDQQSEKINAEKQNPKDHLFLFAEGLIAHIEALQNNFLALSEKVTGLAGQHNGFFKLEKTINAQKDFLNSEMNDFKNLLNQAKKTSTEITDKQKELVQNATATSTKNLEATNKEIMKQTQQTQLTEFNALKNELQKAIDNQTQTMNDLQKKFTQQNEEMFKEKENAIDTKSQDLDKKVSNVEQLLASNQENLKNLQTFNDQLTIMQNHLEHLKNGFSSLNTMQIPKINNQIQNISEIRLSDLQFQNAYNTSNNTEISNLQNRNFYLICGLIGSGTITIGLFIFFYWYIAQIQSKLALLEARLV